MTLAPAARPNPYIGPRSFRTGETLYGRARETEDLLGLLIAERIVLLHSPSGAGKTSLVQAALIPRLVEREFSVLPVMRVNLDPPGSLELRVKSSELDDATPNSHLLTPNPQSPTPNPPNRYILSLLLSLEEVLPPEQQTPLAELAGMSLNEYLDRRLSGAADEGVVLIFDQFEEILTVDPTSLEAKYAFFAQVGAALRNRRRWALFSMREDYVAALDPYVRPVPTRLSTTYRLDLLGADAARAAIQEPARSAGAEFEMAAARQLIEDLSRVQVQRADGQVEERPGPWVEPVQLQVVCYRLWSRLPEGARQIGMGEVETLGNVDTALSDYYAEHVAEVAAETGAGERPIREWFDRALITPEGRRGQVLQTYEQSQGLPNRAIWPLIDAYLVRAEKRRGATWFELAHDRLIEPVRENNAAWREAHLSPFQRQADLWDSRSRPDMLVLRDAALVEAEAWSEANAGELTDVERAFLARCLEVREIVRRARRNRRIISLLATIASIVGVIALGAAVYALAARDRAKAAESDALTQRDAAVRARNEAIARQLAAQSLESREQRPQRSLLLALEAFAPQSAVHQPSATSALDYALATAGGTPLRGHTAAIAALAFSPDGRYLATAGDDFTVRRWDVANPTAAPLVLRGHRAQIMMLAFSPDGRYLATGSFDNTARLWDMSNPTAAPTVLEGHERRITVLAFSPDSRRLATASADGTARLWNVGSPSATLVVLNASADPTVALAFSPDGRRLATGGDDTTVRLWDVANPSAAPTLLEGHTETIRVMAFSPDGRFLASGGDDDTARIWEVARAGAPPIVLEGHQGALTALAFSPDSRRLATGSVDNTARLWELTRSPPVAVLLGGHTNRVNGLAFSPDGRFLATASSDNTARVWDVANPAAAVVLRGHESPINALAFSPDSRRLATGADDGTARLWELARISALPTLRGHTNQVTALAFSPDGRYAATAGDDNTARVWDLSQPAAPLTLEGHEESVSAIAFSPDGRRLATGSTDTKVRVWDLSQPAAAPLTFEGHNATIARIVFRPDGRFLISADFDGMVDQWDLAAPQTQPITLRDAGEGALATALSPDGRYLAVDTADNSVQVWDLTQPTLAAVVLRGHDSSVHALAFSPDGRQLATGGADRTIRLWDLPNPTNPAIVLRGHSGPVTALAFSPDSRSLVSGSADQTARLWDLSDLAAEPIVLQGHTKAVLAAEFSPDGRAVATGSADNTARLWRVSQNELMALACATAGRNLSWDEWQQSLGAEPYRKTCPDLPVSPSLIDTAAGLIGLGDLQGALALAQGVTELGAADEIPARSWSDLCRAGSLAGHVAEVRDACGRAVALAPDDGQVHDSRGLARALGKDLKGAAEDFQAYVAWAQQNGQDAERITQREAWIAELQAGRDPFSLEVLQRLRRE